MKNTYLIIAVLMFILGLIIAFENIILQSNGMRILFWVTNTSMFFPLLILFCLGMISGFFFGLAKGTRGNDYNNLDI